MRHFNKAVEAFGAAHDAVTENGERLLAVQYLDTIQVARLAAENGGDINAAGSEWADAYKAAINANLTLRAAAYKLGYALAPVKPPSVGPSVVIG